MSKTKVVLNSAGVRELLRSDAIANYCETLANQVAQRAGTGYATDKHVGKNRVNVSVYADSYEAYQDNLTNNTLIKSIY